MIANPVVWLLGFQLALLVIFSLMEPTAFGTWRNIRNIAIDASLVLVLSVGMTFVIITAGIDLSVGTVAVFSSVVGVKAMELLGSEGWDAVLLGLAASVAAGCAWGAANGFCVAALGLPPFVVTLGTFGMALGAALLLTNGTDLTGVPSVLSETVGFGRLFGEIPILVLLALSIAGAGWILLSLTRFGRYTYAIGSSSEAAMRAGINVRRHLLSTYVLAGLTSGIAGFLSLARYSSTTIAGHSTDNLQAVTAVVLGGTSLFGGVGTMLGTIVAVYVPATIQNGLVIIGTEPFWQMIAIGFVLIVAVYIDQLRLRRRVRA